MTADDLLGMTKLEIIRELGIEQKLRDGWYWYLPYRDKKKKPMKFTVKDLPDVDDANS